MNPEKICKNCRHFGPKTVDSNKLRDDHTISNTKDYGTFKLFELDVNIHGGYCGKINNSPLIDIDVDYGYGTWVNVYPDFGCVLFEPKIEDEEKKK